MKAVKIIIAMLLCGSVYGQTVTPNPGPYQNISTKYQYTWQKWTGGIWNLGKLVQTDSAMFAGITYVPNAPENDSSTQAANTGWIKRNIAPGIPGQPVLTWAYRGNYTDAEPTQGRLGFLDSADLHLITNNGIRLTIPSEGINRGSGGANKVLLIDTTTRKLYYTDMTGGGSSLDTTNLHGRGVAYYQLEGDSAVLTLNDSSKYSVAIGGGGGTPSLTQYRLAVGDASNLLSTNAAITGGRALASDANGVPVASSTTATELGYVNGVTSSIQTQLNAKLSNITGLVTAGTNVTVTGAGTGPSPYVVGLSGIIPIANGGTGYSTYDTTALASFGGGSGAAGDTAVFSTSAIYGSFFNSGYDTLYITRIQVGLQGTSPSVAVKVWYNDSLNVTAGGTALVTAGNTCTDIYTGTSITTFDNYKIPPGMWVWVKTSTVTTKPTYFTLTLIGYKKRV